MTDESQEKADGLRLCTTPALLAVFDEKLPGHGYGTSFPATLLLDPSFTGLADLLAGTSVYADKTVQADEPDTGHRERMKAVEAELSESSYQALVAPRDTLSPSGLTIASLLEPSSADGSRAAEGRRLRNQVSTIVNIAISMMTAAMAAWYWTPQGVGLPKRVLVCFASAVALGAAEVFLYLRYLVKIDQGRQYDLNVTRREKLVIPKGDTTLDHL